MSEVEGKNGKGPGEEEGIPMACLTGGRLINTNRAKLTKLPLRFAKTCSLCLLFS